MELQISHRLCAKVPEEGILRRKAAGNRGDLENAVRLEGDQYHRSGGVPRPRAYAPGNTAKGFDIKFHGISQREKQSDDIREVSRAEV